MNLFNRNKKPNGLVVKDAPEFQLGDLVRDKVTQFEGAITCCTLHITMCDVYTVMPNKTDSDGKPLDAKAYDEIRLELITPKSVDIGVYSGDYVELRNKVGWEVKDKVDGLTGTVTAISMESGESVALIQPPVSEGKEPKSYWRTIPTLEFVNDRRQEVGVPELVSASEVEKASEKPKQPAPARTGAGEVPDREPVAPPGR